MPDHPKPTVEELLRLKRAERPDAAFWAEFDRELRAKQLAALVRQPVWWRVSWARIGSGVVRVGGALGAVAALMLAVFNHRSAPAPLPADHQPMAAASAAPETQSPSPTLLPANLSVLLAVAASPELLSTPDSATKTTEPALPVTTASAPAPIAAVASTAPPESDDGRPDEATLADTLALAEFAPFDPEPATLDVFAPLPDDPASISVLATAVADEFPAAIRQWAAMFRHSDAETHDPTAATAMAQARELVARRLDPSLVSSISSRRIFDLEGSSVSVRF